MPRIDRLLASLGYGPSSDRIELTGSGHADRKGWRIASFGGRARAWARLWKEGPTLGAARAPAAGQRPLCLDNTTPGEHEEQRERAKGGRPKRWRDNASGIAGIATRRGLLPI